MRCSRSVGHLRNETNHSTRMPSTGTSISKAQAPLKPARCRMRQVGTTSSAIRGVIITKTMNQCVELNVHMAGLLWRRMYQHDLLAKYLVRRPRVL